VCTQYSTIEREREREKGNHSDLRNSSSILIAARMTDRLSLPFLDPPDGDERLATVAAAERYGRFVGRLVEIA
jgi:hypothetical protein